MLWGLPQRIGWKCAGVGAMIAGTCPSMARRPRTSRGPTRSTARAWHSLRPDQRVWWDVTVLEGDRRFEFHWPWLPGEAWETTVTVLLEPAGYATLLTLTDGPFDLRVPGVLDAYAEALEGWGEALAWLRGVVDFSSDLRPRQY